MNVLLRYRAIDHLTTRTLVYCQWNGAPCVLYTSRCALLYIVHSSRGDITCAGESHGAYFWFDVSGIERDARLLEAELHVYRLPPQSDAAREALRELDFIHVRLVSFHSLCGSDIGHCASPSCQLISEI